MYALQPSQKASASKQPVTKRRHSSASNSLIPSNSILSLHSTLGNRAVQRLVESGALQPKLTVGAPNDIYEQEADRVADQVMRMPETPGSGFPRIMPLQRITPVQRMCPECEEDLQKQESNEKEELQRQSFKAEDGGLGLQRSPGFLPTTIQRLCPECEGELHRQEAEPDEDLQRQPLVEDDNKDILQAKGSARETPEVTQTLESQIHAQKGGGQPLPAASRDFFGPRMGADFSSVRVHTGAGADTLNRDLNARAFTTGQDIFFRQGEYNPGASKGQKLLAHELTHVVQQRGVLSKISCSGKIQRAVNDRRVSCHRYPRTYPIFRAIGTDDPVGVIRAADTRAIELLDNVINTLTTIRASVQGGAAPARPLISDALAQSMRTRLRMNATDRNVWTGRGPGTAELIIRWYTNTRRLLAGGSLWYTCISSECDPGTDAWVFVGRRRIYLCRRFWRNMNNDERALTLIHEATHIYYGTEDFGGGPGSAWCLEQFVSDIMGLGINPGRCRAPAP